MSTHVLHEASSPPEAMVWTMWCGAQCLAFDDGSVIPEDMCFYGEEHADKADCWKCRLTLEVNHVSTQETEGAT